PRCRRHRHQDGYPRSPRQGPPSCSSHELPPETLAKTQGLVCATPVGTITIAAANDNRLAGKARTQRGWPLPPFYVSLNLDSLLCIYTTLIDDLHGITGWA